MTWPHATRTTVRVQAYTTVQRHDKQMEPLCPIMYAERRGPGFQQGTKLSHVIGIILAKIGLH